MASTGDVAINPLKVGVIVLTIGTALIHLQGFPLFILNGLGYLTLLAALTLPIPRISQYPPLPGPPQYRRFGPRLMAHHAPPKQMAAMRHTMPRVG